MTMLQELVLGLLLASDDGLDFDELAARSGFHPDPVVRALDELHDRGYVTLHASRPMWRPVRYEEQAA